MGQLSLMSKNAPWKEAGDFTVNALHVIVNGVADILISSLRRVSPAMLNRSAKAMTS
jgi:hypothetical protein